MRLPVELRLIVLRDLLVNAQPLLYRRLYETRKFDEMAQGPEATSDSPAIEEGSLTSPKAHIDSGYDLNPVVLYVCQQLYAEGRPVLYVENTIGLRVNASAETSRIVPQGQAMSLPPRSMSLLAYDAFRYIKGMKLLHEQATELASRFRNFHIALYISRDKTPTRFPRRALQCLAPAMTGSTVGVHVYAMDSADDTTTMCFLRAFKLIRCKTLSLVGVPDSLASQAQRVIATATGDSPVVDLGKRLDQIWDHQSLDYIMRSGYRGPWFGYTGWAARRLGALETAAKESNTEAFHKTISQMGPELRKASQRIRERLIILATGDPERNSNGQQLNASSIRQDCEAHDAAVQAEYTAASDFLKAQLKLKT